MDENRSDEWRKIVAEQLAFSRSAEKRGFLVADRDAADYAAILSGVQHWLTYIRHGDTTGKRPTVLDIGAGVTKAIAQIAQSSYGEHVIFKATVLTGKPEIDQYLGRDNVLITPVELLRGVGDKTIAGILSVNGLAYSAEPERAIKRADEVLLPGGALKATFQDAEHWNPALKMNTHPRFTSALQDLGYDVAIEPNPNYQVDVVVGVKPGGSITASELLHRDLSTWRAQYISLKQKFFSKEALSTE